MTSLEQFLGLSFYGNTVAHWLSASAVFIVAVAGLRIFQLVVLHRLTVFTAGYRLRGPRYILMALERTNLLVLIVVGLRIASEFVTLPPRADRIIDGAAIIAVFLQCGLWISAFYAAWYIDYRAAHIKDNATAITTLDATKILVRLFIWVCITLLVLNNLGFNVSALVTGLGVGGVAIALAVQQILGDILASLAIVTDKPFAVGDFIVLGDFMGSVEHIGLKTTRVRSLSGEQIIFANSDLLSSRVRNYGRMFERRLEVNLAIAYDTPRDKLELVPKIIKATILKQDKVRFDRAHFLAFGPTSLIFQYVYFVLSPDNNLYMDIQQTINLELVRLFAEEQIAFAPLPTQTVHVLEHALPPAPNPQPKAA